MVLGIIGGIGSGKSFVSGVLKDRYKFTLLSTDLIAKELETAGGRIYCLLTEEFGDSILASGSDESSLPPIDKDKLSAIIYSDKKFEERVNEIVHPAVWDYVEDFLAGHRDLKTRGIAVETSLPGERFRKACDRVWYIYADPVIRAERLILNRGMTRERINAVMSMQPDERRYIGLADDIIDNSGSSEDTLKIIGELLG